MTNRSTVWEPVLWGSSYARGEIMFPSKSALEKLGTGGEIERRNSFYEELTLPLYVSSCLIQRGSACPLICEC